MGNHGLWLAFVIYLAMRGIIQALMMRSRFTSRPS
jgi:Na+-driven multidrug efflux pump